MSQHILKADWVLYPMNNNVLSEADQEQLLEEFAKKLADQFFFETLVRVHRASEGEPFTGLKPAGSDLPPVVPVADQALETGSMDKVAELITHAAREGLEVRFKEARERKRHADESVAAGREYVHAYVAFLHYAERLYLDATGAMGEHGGEAAADHGAAHER